jgi:hypothetical protein
MIKIVFAELDASIHIFPLSCTQAIFSSKQEVKWRIMKTEMEKVSTIEHFIYNHVNKNIFKYKKENKYTIVN